jgi:6-pyruvoyltetrahydropterin/6-carboxytetrahydropterin synthase
MSKFQSTKVIELGSCAFRQPQAHGTRCKLLHGYKLTAKFWFGASNLDERNWVVNFGGLKELKSKLNDQFDHTLTIAADDPLLPLFQQLHDAGGCDLRVMSKGVGIERVAEYCFEVADAHIREITNNRCWVDQVEVFEHELNSAIYSTQQQLAIDVSQPTTSTETVVTSPAAAPANTQPTPSSSRPAHVGPNNSPGKGDWFKGTSWG